jgi:hypothetical protein
MADIGSESAGGGPRHANDSKPDTKGSSVQRRWPESFNRESKYEVRDRAKKTDK